MKIEIILMPIGVGLDQLQMQYMVLQVVSPVKTVPPARFYKSSLSAPGISGRRQVRRNNKKPPGNGNKEQMDI